MKQYIATLTKQQHQKENNKMATITRDPRKVQQQEIDISNTYVDKVAADVLGSLNKIQTIAKRTNDTTSPLLKASGAVNGVFSTMISKIKALNADTTQTEDAITLKQANLIEESLTTSRSIVDKHIVAINTLTNEQESKLFSRSVDESPRGLAILGNSVLLEKIQKDPLGNMTNEVIGNAVNAFRLYGLLGGEDLQDSLAISLDNRFSETEMEVIKELNRQKAALQNIDNTLTSTHQLLLSDADRIVAIRNRKVS